MQPNKKIMIACPTLGLSPDPDRWIRSLLSVIAETRRLHMDFTFFAPYKELWWQANNMIWDNAFEHEFDYILRIDDDIWDVPLDGLTKLYEADKDVIGAAYPSRHFPYFVCAVKRTKQMSLVDSYIQNDCSLKYVDVPDSGDMIVPVDLVGFGMTLIKVETFRRCKRPIYQGVQNCPDDTYFAQLCLDRGVQQFVHFGVRLAHQHLTFDNNGHMFNADIIRMAKDAKESNEPKPSESEVRKIAESAPVAS